MKLFNQLSTTDKMLVVQHFSTKPSLNDLNCPLLWGAYLCWTVKRIQDHSVYLLFCAGRLQQFPAASSFTSSFRLVLLSYIIATHKLNMPHIVNYTRLSQKMTARGVRQKLPLPAQHTPSIPLCFLFSFFIFSTANQTTHSADLPLMQTSWLWVTHSAPGLALVFASTNVIPQG